jgi:hypothetical protein
MITRFLLHTSLICDLVAGADQLFSVKLLWSHNLVFALIVISVGLL